MRVTFVLPGLDMTGGNRVVSIYARMLMAAGNQVLTIVPGQDRNSWRRRLVKYLGKGRAQLAPTTPESHFDGLGLEVRCLDRRRPVVDADLPDADVVVATWWETAEWVAALSPSKGAKVYFIQHHEVFDYMPIDRVRATYRLPLHKVVVAPWLQEAMLQAYGDHDVDLVPNAVDHGLFHAPVRSRQAVRAVGFMYSTAAFKASNVAVEVLRRLRQDLPDLKVLAFGHQSPVGTEFLGSDIEFHLQPSQEVIRSCYARCDVWLATSASEGFNLPALEAMACRTPVVSTRTGWPATAVVDGFNGYGAAIGDVDGLYHGVLKVLGATDWERLSRNAYETAARLTWQESYQLFVDSLVRTRQRHVVAAQG